MIDAQGMMNKEEAGIIVFRSSFIVHRENVFSVQSSEFALFTESTLILNRNSRPVIRRHRLRQRHDDPGANEHAPRCRDEQ